MSDTLLDKFEGIKIRFEEVSEQISDPDLMKDMKRYVKVNQDYKQLDLLVKSFARYEKLMRNISDAREMLENESDEDLRVMAKEELENSEQLVQRIEDEIRFLLVPADPEDRMLFLKYVEVQVVMKRLFLQETFTGCMRNTATRKVGKWR